MKKRRLLAALGAAMLSLGLVGIALASDTGESDRGVTPTEVDDNIGLPSEGSDNKDKADCEADTEEWETVDAFAIKTGDTGGSATTESGVTVTWTYDGGEDGSKEFGFTATGGLVSIAYVKGGNSGYNEYDYTGFPGGGVASDGGMFAPNTGQAHDKPAGLSHAVFCTVAGGVEPSPTMGEPDPTPTFNASQQGITECPCDTDLGANTSAPADGAWLLVVALGGLLASIVVLTPARAKRQR